MVASKKFSNNSAAALVRKTNIHISGKTYQEKHVRKNGETAKETSHPGVIFLRFPPPESKKYRLTDFSRKAGFNNTHLQFFQGRAVATIHTYKIFKEGWFSPRTAPKLSNTIRHPCSVVPSARKHVLPDSKELLSSLSTQPCIFVFLFPA